MAQFSFDLVSEVDLQEVDNAVNQAKKEMSQRYDFKDSRSSIEFDRDKKEITLVGDDDFKLRSVTDILSTKLAKRGVSLKSLTFADPEKAFAGTLRQCVTLASGIPREKAKELTAAIKGLNLKVQTQIEGEKIKISGAKKDDLQAVIQHLKQIDFSIPLGFVNFR